MVEVVIPLRVQAVPAGLRRGHEPGIVGVGLGDQHQIPVQPSRERPDLGGQLLQQVHSAAVLERVHRVEPQTVQMVVAQPHQRVRHDERPDLVGARLVQVDRGAPGRDVRIGEVRAEVGEPVAGAHVVVDDVEQDSEARGRGTHRRTA